MKITCAFSPEPVRYDIEIGEGVLALLPERLVEASRIVIITDEVVEALYGKSLLESFLAVDPSALLFSFPPGEGSKTRATLFALQDKLCAAGVERGATVLALGGGVVSDIAGCLAATYCRGVAWVVVPTTLLAMADACIGGKVGLNLLKGKNRFGAIYQPEGVFIDVEVLRTLPREEWSNGFAEIIKHGFIADVSLVELLEKTPVPLASCLPETLRSILEKSCRVKTRFVERDPRERDVRACLNFGHTVGHALEELSTYSVSHGQAVAAGMLVEATMAMLLDQLSCEVVDRLRSLLLRCGLLQGVWDVLRHLGPEQLFTALTLDKKTVFGVAHFVCLKDVGACFDPPLMAVRRDVFFAACEKVCHDMRRH